MTLFMILYDHFYDIFNRDCQDADFLYKTLVTGTDLLLRQCKNCTTLRKFVLTSGFMALADQFENNREYSGKVEF